MEKAILREFEPGELVGEECEPILYTGLILEGEVEITYRRDAEMGMSSFKCKQLHRDRYHA